MALDYAVLLERVDFRRAEPKTLEDFLGMFAQKRRRAAHRSRSIRELERNAGQFEHRNGWVTDSFDYAARFRMRILESIGDGIDAPAWNACFLQFIDPELRTRLAQHLLDHIVDYLSIFDAVAVLFKARVVGPFGVAQY